MSLLFHKWSWTSCFVSRNLALWRQCYYFLEFWFQCTTKWPARRSYQEEATGNWNVFSVERCDQMVFSLGAGSKLFLFSKLINFLVLNILLPPPTSLYRVVQTGARTLLLRVWSISKVVCYKRSLKNQLVLDETASVSTIYIDPKA